MLLPFLELAGVGYHGLGTSMTLSLLCALGLNLCRLQLLIASGPRGYTPGITWLQLRRQNVPSFLISVYDLHWWNEASVSVPLAAHVHDGVHAYTHVWRCV
jgi:hypothetical protein